MRFFTLVLTSLFLAIANFSFAQEHDHSKEAIELNNGKKWKVDSNMMTHIKQMESDVKTTTSAKNKDFSTLNTQLLKGIAALTSNCTMTGQAHDELHKWLVPFIGTVNEFNDKLNVKEQQLWFAEVQDAMKEFNTYFN